MTDRAQALAYRTPPTFVVDVETVSTWQDLPPEAREALAERHAKADARVPEDYRTHPEDVAALSPWTAKAVVIAVRDLETDRARVFYEAPKGTPVRVEGGDRFEACGAEDGLLEAFWGVLARNPAYRVAGYNSRTFDGTFLMVRSYVRGVRASRNLVPYRYSTREHADLYDLLGFWGTVRNTPSLDVVCRLTGIPSPKDGMSGADVEDAYRAGDILEIARYCAKDTRAEAEALRRWEATLAPVFQDRRK
jgi:hypothetical protein